MMLGAAKLVGGAVAQVGIQLALEKVAFNKDVQQTTKQTESAFAKSATRTEGIMKKAFTGVKNTAVNTFNKIKDKTSEIFNKISNIIKVALVAATAFFIKFSKDAINAASETQAAWTGLKSIVDGTGKSFVDAKGFIEEYTKDGLVPLTDAVTAYKTLAARGYSTEEIEGLMTALKDSAAFGRQSAYTLGEAVKSAAEGLKNENSILVDNAGVTKNVAKMWDEYAESIGTTANNLTLAQKRQAEYQGIMAETKFQTGDAAAYMDTYAGKLAKVSTAFFNLKVTVGQVLTPIIELFLPAIEAGINALTRMFNKLKSIMAVFGLEMKEYISKGTSSAMSSATESTSGLSSGMESAGDTATKTAKKIKKAFGNLDEINVLNTSNNTSDGSGGSSGGSGDSSGGTGDTDSTLTDIEEDESVIAQKLEWLTRSAYDWGVKFGEAINKGMEAIPWDKIQGTVVNVVSKIAQFLNGATDGIDWHLLGWTLSEGFNTVFLGLNTFFAEYNWDNLGTSLGEGINGFIEGFDWKTTGEFLARKFSVPFQILSNMFETMDWSNMGKSLTDGLNRFVNYVDFQAIADTLEHGLNGAIDFMWSAITNFNVENAAEKLGGFVNSISTAIKNIDWNKLGQTLSEGVHKAITFLREFIKKVDWGELVKNLIDGIVNFIVGIDWGQLLLDLGGLLIDVGAALLEGLWAGIKAGLVGVGKILYDILVQPIVDGVKALFGINSPSTVFAEMGGFLIEGLWSGISGLKDWIVGKWETVKGWFSDIVKNAKVAITQKWNDIKKGWTDLTSNIKDKTASMKAKVATKWNDIKKSWSDTTKNIKNKTADMKARIATKWSSLKNSWSNITKNIKDKTADMKARVATKWSSLRNTWNSLMSHFKDKTVSIKVKVGEAVGSFKSTINDKIIKPINKKLPSFFPQIPYLAQGSWFDKNNPTLAVVGDNKQEPEIVTPESKIYDQTRKAVEDAGGVTNNNQHFDFTIKLEYPDGKYLIKEINDTQIKDGKVSLLV